MKDLLTPSYMFPHYYDVTPAFLREIGVEALLIDIDNTLAPYEEPDPNERTICWFREMSEAGIRLALISNNHPPRVERFNKNLGVLAFANSKKPRRRTLLLAMEQLGSTVKNTAVLGDQLLTDAYAGKHLGMPALIVPPIRDKRNLFFRFKRWCERPFIRKYARKCGYQPFMAFWKIRDKSPKKEI